MDAYFTVVLVFIFLLLADKANKKATIRKLEEEIRELKKESKKTLIPKVEDTD